MRAAVTMNREQEKSRAARQLLSARGVRAFGDGCISLLLPVYLVELGFGTVEVGIVTTATLLGSAAATMLVGLVAHRLRRGPILRAASLLMIATGIGFAATNDLWPLVVIAFVGTINPSSGDVSLFLPLEHALLAESVEPERRTQLFGRYSLVGALVGAVGSLAAGLPEMAVATFGTSLVAALKCAFVLYGLGGVAVLALYRFLPASIEHAGGAPPQPLGPSRKRVYSLAALFSIDSFGGGFMVQSLLALWLLERFDLSLQATGSIFFWTGLLAAFSFPVAVWLSRHIGLVNTMVWTHIPANLAAIALALTSNLYVAIGLLLFRGALSSMDVPARTSYVMAVVSPAERAAAVSVTNVPRSLASAISPLFAGWLFTLSPIAWPLVIGGTLKAGYDLLLLAMFRRVKPPEEAG